MKKLITVSDWGNDSLYKHEVYTAVEGHVGNPLVFNIRNVTCSSSTIEAGYLLAQIIYTEERLGRPLETVIMVDVDTRTFATEGVDDAIGADAFLIKLFSGVYVVGPNAGSTFSLIKDKIEKMYSYVEGKKGSFRARDTFSRMCASLIQTEEDDLVLDEVMKTQIMDLEDHYIGHIDHFGTIKTTYRREDLKGNFEVGEKIPVTIGTITQSATLVDNLFSGTVGELVIYPSTTGEIDNPFLDVSVWQHSFKESTITAATLFQKPSVGEVITFV